MRIGIVGLGLIGGSLAGALTRAGHEVSGLDTDGRSEFEAVRRGWIESALPMDGLARTSDIVILCAPVDETIAMIPAVAANMRPDAILTDVASVKRPVLVAMNEIADGPRTIGGHPMAGKATGGIESADPSLFQGAPYALVPDERRDEQILTVLRDLVREIGAEPVEMDAETHDREVAATSHLPQLLSTALGMALSGRPLPLSGPGLAGMLRLAASDERLWSAVLALNADNVVREAGNLREQIDELVAAVRSGDRPRIEASMKRAAGGPS